MAIWLSIFAGLAFLAGVALLGAAQSAIHEIQGFIAWLAFAVLLTGACIVRAVEDLRSAIRRLTVASEE